MKSSSSGVSSGNMPAPRAIDAQSASCHQCDGSMGKLSTSEVCGGCQPTHSFLPIQGRTSSWGSSEISSVLIRPVATPVPNAPSVSASNAPMARAHLRLWRGAHSVRRLHREGLVGRAVKCTHFDGESTMNAGKSVSNTLKAAAKLVWHVASIQLKDSGPPARLIRILLSISR